MLVCLLANSKDSGRQRWVARMGNRGTRRILCRGKGGKVKVKREEVRLARREISSVSLSPASLKNPPTPCTVLHHNFETERFFCDLQGRMNLSLKSHAFESELNADRTPEHQSHFLNFKRSFMPIPTSSNPNHSFHPDPNLTRISSDAVKEMQQNHLLPLTQPSPPSVRPLQPSPYPTPPQSPRPPLPPPCVRW